MYHPFVDTYMTRSIASPPIMITTAMQWANPLACCCTRALLNDEDASPTPTTIGGASSREEQPKKRGKKLLLLLGTEEEEEGGGGRRGTTTPPPHPHPPPPPFPLPSLLYFAAEEPQLLRRSALHDEKRWAAGESRASNLLRLLEDILRWHAARYRLQYSRAGRVLGDHLIAALNARHVVPAGQSPLTVNELRSLLAAEPEHRLRLFYELDPASGLLWIGSYQGPAGGEGEGLMPIARDLRLPPPPLFSGGGEEEEEGEEVMVLAGPPGAAAAAASCVVVDTNKHQEAPPTMPWPSSSLLLLLKSLTPRAAASKEEEKEKEGGSGRHYYYSCYQHYCYYYAPHDDDEAAAAAAAARASSTPFSVARCWRYGGAPPIRLDREDRESARRMLRSIIAEQPLDRIALSYHYVEGRMVVRRHDPPIAYRAAPPREALAVIATGVVLRNRLFTRIAVADDAIHQQLGAVFYDAKSPTGVARARRDGIVPGRTRSVMTLICALTLARTRMEAAVRIDVVRAMRVANVPFWLTGSGVLIACTAIPAAFIQ